MVKSLNCPIPTHLLPDAQRKLGDLGLRFISNPRTAGGTARIDFEADDVQAFNAFNRWLQHITLPPCRRPGFLRKALRRIIAFLQF